MMKEVLRRLAIAAWWFGAIVMGFGVVGAVWLLFRDGLTGDSGALALFALPITLPCWAASYVFGGSFWRPPKAP